jgi:hypothetical protein
MWGYEMTFKKKSAATVKVSGSALICIVSSLHYLCVQGLAVRGHSEDLGNFENFLKLRATDNAALKSWLEKSGYRWLSPVIQNEIMQDFALSVQRFFMQHMMDVPRKICVMFCCGNGISVEMFGTQRISLRW